VEVELRQQLANFLGAAREQRQNTAFEPFLKAPNPRTSDLDGPTAGREATRLAIPISVATPSIYCTATLIPLPAEELTDFLFDDRLDATSDLTTEPFL